MKKILKILVGSGLIVAAGAVVLYGTKRGIRFRKKLIRTTEEWYGDIAEKIEDWREVSKEYFDVLVERVVKTYAAKKEWATEQAEAVIRELTKTWWEFQVYYLYHVIKNKVNKEGVLLREKYYELVDKVAHEYGEKQMLSKDATEKLTDTLKEKWKLLREENEKNSHKIWEIC